MQILSYRSRLQGSTLAITGHLHSMGPFLEHHGALQDCLSLAMISTNCPTPAATFLLVNSYEALFFSLGHLLISLFLELARHTSRCLVNWAFVPVHISSFPLPIGWHSNSSISGCLHSFATKLYRHINMKRKLFRIKTALSLLCRNEYFSLGLNYSFLWFYWKRG